MKYYFAKFELDTDRQELRNGNQVVPIAPKAFSVLAYLVAQNERMVSKSELMETFWSRHASEAALQKSISLVRKALADDDPSAPIITTVHGRGFRFSRSLDAGPMPTPQPNAKGQNSLQEQRQVAVLCVQMSYAQGQITDRSDVTVFLNTAREIVAADQGKLLHMMVDRFTATFGLDPEYEDSVRRAAQCAWRLRQADKINALRTNGLCMTLSIDAGAVTLVDDAQGLEWQAPSGIELEAVALAETTPRDAVLITQAALDQLRNEAEVTPLDVGFELTDLISGVTGIPARPSKRPTGFVARDAELAFLNSCLAQARSGAFQAVTLSGPAGIGKSRLTEEFLNGLPSSEARICKIHCVPRLQNAALAPIRQMCTALLQGMPDVLTEDPVDAAIAELLTNENAAPNSILDSLSDRKRNARSLALIQGILRQASEQTSLTVVFEDIHWLDATSRGTLAALLRKASMPNVFMLLTTRPTDNPALAESILHLPPLGSKDSLRLIRAMPLHAHLNETDAATLAARAEGNPFFLEELVLAVESGADPRLDLPNTVHAVIEVRIGTLTTASRNLLYVMAIIGDSPPLDLITHLTRRDTHGVEDDLLRLTQQGFLLEDNAGFSFRHMLLNDTAYAMVEKSDRKRLHAEIAQYLEASHDATRDETLAWHHQEAGHSDVAVSYWTKASYAAMHRSARPEAILFAQSGLALMNAGAPAQAEAELSLRLALATALMAARGYGAKEVGVQLDKALALSATAGAFKSKIRVVLGLWVHTWVAGKLTTSLEHATTLLGMAAQAKDPSLHLQAHAGAGEVLTHLGRFDEAMDHLVTGLAGAEQANTKSVAVQNAAVTCSAYAAWVSGMQGQVPEMKVFSDTSLSLSRSRKNPFAEAIHFALCSEAYMFVGDVQKTAELANQAVKISRENGFPFWLGTGLVMQGWSLGMTSDFDRALGKIDEGIAVFERTGAGVQFTNWYGLKAETHFRAGQIQAGLDAGHRAMGFAERTQDIWFTPRVHAVLAGLYGCMQNDKMALTHANQAKRLQVLNRLGLAFISVTPPMG